MSADGKAGAVAPLDLKREFRHLYSATRTPAFVEVPDLPFLMIDGHGDPDTAPAYPEAVQALYAMAYAIRFGLKRGPEGLDAPVMPLEGLWWASDMSVFTTGDKSQWDWTMMITVPEQVTARTVEDARADASRKKSPSAIARVRLEHLAEGRCAQVMHIGPYSAEGPTIAALHAFIADQGCVLAGKHHEIYLGDPRRAAPEKLRTIVRQPLAPAAQAQVGRHFRLQVRPCGSQVRSPPDGVGGPA